ncbi:MAG: phage tail tip lysozyme [Lachnospiraceae bacterium]|nr:phage tail tip lysozyme [Lachnospiraceae bacterium]
MSNSPLVTYTRISPKKSSPRNHAIDTITIHCIVGQWTAKQGCDYFATTDRDCSANYVVGKDGSIGLSVDEKDRSWCTSSRDNDNRAITIEVASDTKHPYAVTDAAYDALIKLVADICKRNGIKKLLWKADKSLIGQVSKQNMTVHRWFANKSCPGEYLYERHSDIAAKVNAILGAVEQETPAPVTPEVTTPATDNPSAIWNFFKGKGLNDFAVAGIMGNLYAESGFKPTNLQNTYEKKLGYTDDSYTAAVDNGSYTNFVKDSAGYGLVQWTYWSRKQALLEYAKSVGKSIGDLTMQLDFMWKEMQGYKSMMTVLNSATSILEASNAVLTQYEKPADQSETVQNKRAGYGQTYYDKYAQKTPESTSTDGLYRVQVGAYSKLDNANKQLAAVKAKGFDALIKKVGNLYKVQTGAYSVKANAEAQLDRVKAAGFTDAYITTESGGTVVATDDVQEPSYITYKVKRGDSLWSIAKANLGNGSRWPEIKSLNNLTSNTIYAGQTLKLPD